MLDDGTKLISNHFKFSHILPQLVHLHPELKASVDELLREEPGLPKAVGIGLTRKTAASA